MQKFVKFFHGFLEKFKTSQIYSEINWPVVARLLFPSSALPPAVVEDPAPPTRFLEDFPKILEIILALSYVIILVFVMYNFRTTFTNRLAESSYSVKYGSSNITSIIPSNNLFCFMSFQMVFLTISYIGILILFWC